MKLLISFVLLAFCLKLAFLQQCRQVTVCNDDMSNGDVTKGNKGDVGIPGKAGNKGIKGEPGEIGRKGIQGESCSLGSFGDRLMEKLTRLEELLTVTTTTPTTTTSSTTTTTAAPALSSCADASTTNGVHTLQNGDEVLCENGWTVFQRRTDGTEDFEQTWDAYRTGFGQMTGEFWLGLDKIYRLTRSGNCRLKIEVWDFDDVYKYANYNGFSVDDESNLFRLHIGSYSGTAGDALQYHNNRPFTTHDRDNDSKPNGNCADEYGGSGGWWYGLCRRSALNAVWGRSKTRGKLEWWDWKHTGGLEATKMMFRCDEQN
ncbi:fibrinogen-like protein A [Clavelina lepadiformis]|uniref:fibrinogen-like protein A n=1 Tax=Clavelina lepadiformis TaxID=159417 RepID=UPI00404254EA